MASITKLANTSKLDEALAKANSSIHPRRFAFLDGPHDGGRAGHFAAGHRLSSPTEIAGQKRFGPREEINAVLRPREAVSLIRIDDIGDIASVFRNRVHNLL